MMAAARDTLLSCNWLRLAEFGGDVAVTWHWASQAHEFCQAQNNHSQEQAFNWRFCMTEGSVPGQCCDNSDDGRYPSWVNPELGSDWDQDCAFQHLNNGRLRLEEGGSTCSWSWGITAVFSGSLVGDFLPVQVIYQGKTNRCHPCFEFPSDWNITHSHKHWSNAQTMFQYIKHIITPYVMATRQNFEADTPALTISKASSQEGPMIFWKLTTSMCVSCRKTQQICSNQWICQ